MTNQKKAGRRTRRHATTTTRSFRFPCRARSNTPLGQRPCVFLFVFWGRGQSIAYQALRCGDLSMERRAKESSNSTRPRRHPIPKDVLAAWFAKYPWLKEICSPDAKTSNTRRRLTGDARERAPRDQPAAGERDVTVRADALSDEDIHAIYERLYEIRAETSVDMPGVLFFYARINGGPWCRKHKGKDVDFIQGHPSGSEAIT